MTAFLGALGGLAGALGGVLLAVGMNIALDLRLSARDMFYAFGLAAAIGCAVGVVAGPALTWLLLRRVPIWRAIGETALGAGLAATIALTLGTALWTVAAISLGGATLAALRLRLASRGASSAVTTDRDTS